jgi:hypothetical protein
MIHKENDYQIRTKERYANRIN